MQRLVNNAEVLAMRNIPHPAKLTKDIWQQKYRGASAATKQGRVHNSHRHSLGPTWANIMGPCFGPLWAQLGPIWPLMGQTMVVEPILVVIPG
jgi:hypothetical protein